MALPTKKKIDELNKRIEKLQKKNKGIDEKEACNIMRGAVRKNWMRHPIKLLAVDLATIPDMDPETRTIWKVKCARCKDYHKKNEVEVDHLKGEHSLKKLDDLVPFVISILDVTTDDLQVLCKPCHRIKTYAERYGHSEEDAEKILKAKDWMKETSIEKQKKAFEKLGYSDGEYSNAKKRENLAIKIHKMI